MLKSCGLDRPDETLGAIVLDEGVDTHAQALLKIHKKAPRKRTSDTPLPVHQEAATHHAEVYALAEKYNIKGLKALAEEKFEVALETLYPGWILLRAAQVAYVRNCSLEGAYSHSLVRCDPASVSQSLLNNDPGYGSRTETEGGT
ncbi:hypothetical protein K491DRAFT_249192 [Lophiostoma macrostomum CBS 122681]|uniref:BTB domain-containing protein n=1 Tax=Lophiostoma macrostomum CBS 122681 TaxID=1314788 RepID=A0A6A6SLS8_9PLEO|nr:hypothetical protein K491DRAFT_249192 [Lophiostoma macrostomum CBS 122681]